MQLLKILSSIIVKKDLFSNFISGSEMQRLKQNWPIWVTEEGIFILLKNLQFENEYPSIIFNDDGY